MDTFNSQQNVLRNENSESFTVGKVNERVNVSNKRTYSEVSSSRRSSLMASGAGAGGRGTATPEVPRGALPGRGVRGAGAKGGRRGPRVAPTPALPAVLS